MSHLADLELNSLVLAWLKGKEESEVVGIIWPHRHGVWCEFTFKCVMHMLLGPNIKPS